MGFSAYKSSNVNSTGGPMSDKLVDPSLLFPHIEANKARTEEPNTVYEGKLFRKIFIKNNGPHLVRSCKVVITGYPVDCSIGLCLGDETDSEVIEDNITFPDDIEKRFLYVGDMKPGDHIPVWICLWWPNAAGSPDEIEMNLQVVGSNDAATLAIKFMMDIYEDKLPENDENFISSKLKDILIVFFRNFFYKFYREDLRWHPDRDISKIFIADKLTFNLDNPEQKPSIIIFRNAMTARNLVLNKTQYHNQNTETTQKTDLIMGAMTIQAVAREDIHAEFLGETVFRSVMQLTQIFRDMGVHDITSLRMNDTVMMEVDTKSEVIMVPITMQYAYQDTWKISKSFQHQLDKISYRINSNRMECAGN